MILASKPYQLRVPLRAAPGSLSRHNAAPRGRPSSLVVAAAVRPATCLTPLARLAPPTSACHAAPFSTSPCRARPSAAARSKPAADAPPQVRRSLDALCNPPASTRPPALSLPPARAPGGGVGPLASHLLATGRAYVAFYKEGLKAVFTNRGLARDALDRRAAAATTGSARPGLFRLPLLPDAGPAGGWMALAAPTSGGGLSRSELVLLHRTRHDVSLLPLFGLLLFVAGEFTPLVVLVVPDIVPLTCRIPRQAEGMAKKAAARAGAARMRYAAAESAHGDAQKEAAAADALGLLPPRVLTGLPLFPTSWLARRRLAVWAGWIGADDAALARVAGATSGGGGSGGAVGLAERVARLPLVPEEVRWACGERGMDVEGKAEGELRAALGRWVAASVGGQGEGEEEGQIARLATMVLTGPEKWK